MQRRRLLQAAGISIGTVGLGTFALHEASQPTFAASLTASDVGVTTDDGQITSITAAPDLTIGFDGLDQPIDQLEFGLFSKIPSETSFQPADGSSSGSGYVALAQFQEPKTGGTRSVTLAEQAIRSGSNTEAIDADTDGDTNQTDVTLKVVVQGTDSTVAGDSYQGNVIRAEASATATYTVTVTNASATISASGTANTGINE